MKKICEWCKCEFVPKVGHSSSAKYCSMACSAMAHRKRNQEKREARARELGITVEELIKRTKRGLAWINNPPPRKRKRTKTYAEIKAYNRKHPLVAGWRGAAVMGGGAAWHNNAPLMPEWRR